MILAIYISGLTIKTRIFIINIFYCFSKHPPSEYIYFIHTVFERFNSILLNCWPRIFPVMYENSVICCQGWPFRRFGRCWFVMKWRSRIVMVHNDPSSLVRFRKTSDGVPFRTDRLTFLKKATIFFDLARLYKHRFNDSCDDLINVFWRMPLSQGVTHDDLALSVHARHQCSLAQWLFLNLHDLRLWASVGHDWIH